MIKFLERHFIKSDKLDEDTREKYGVLSYLVGLILNMILFILKILAGILTTSVVIIADAINNLSDFLTSFVGILGFKMAKKPADKKHPFGHQRIEYIAGLIISIVILFVGGSLFYSSIRDVMFYEYNEVSKNILYVTIGILVFSILIKLYLFFFDRTISKKINSKTLLASSYDSLSDMISSTVILIGYIVIVIFGDLGFSLDGILGALVSLFIMYSGFKMIKETTDPLIGSPVKESEIKDILNFIKKNPYVYGIHDIMCHKYGESTRFMTLHAEVDAKKSILDIHSHIDEIEEEVKEKYGYDLTIHMDPVELDNEKINESKLLMEKAINNIDSSLTLHDFRIIKKKGIDTIIFDLVVPYNFKLSNDKLYEILEVEAKKEGYNLIINFDHSFIEK